MANQVQKTNNQVAVYQVRESTRHLLNSIKAGNPLEVARNLNQYQLNGQVKFDAVLSIPLNDRLPSLAAHYGDKKVHAILVIMLTDFISSYNVVRPMNEGQIVACAFEIMITANEDQLSIEDLALFFSGAKRGMYGKNYSSLDQQTIFEMLEIYRQERHENYLKIKEEQNAQMKGLGPAEKTTQHNEIAASMANVVGRLYEMKEKLKEQREINRANRL